MKPRSSNWLIYLVLYIVGVLLFISILPSGNIAMIENNDREPVLLIIAVPSVENHFEERNRLRQMTKQYPQVLCPFCDNKHDQDPKVQLLFFIGRNPETKMFSHLREIRQEMARYQDLVLLSITENMNEGKTWEVLNWVYTNRKADFVMKSDEDSFVNIPSLIERLIHFKQKFPDEYGKLYYGYPWNYGDVPFTTRTAIMIGMGYTMGWDLIEYFATDPNVRKNVVGLEDAVTHQWLFNRTDVLRIGDRVRFHDPPTFKGPVSWTYRCDDVVIHRLKTNELWEDIRDFYLNCCEPVFDGPRQKCRGSPPTSSCCGPDQKTCDRACAPTLRQVEMEKPFTNYHSEEDLKYLDNYLRVSRISSYASSTARSKVSACWMRKLSPVHSGIDDAIEDQIFESFL